MNISAIKLNESGTKNVSLQDIASELMALGKLEDTNQSKFTQTGNVESF